MSPTSTIPTPTGTEASTRADFTRIRYAQCWEDADVLLEALNIAEGDTCLSIASAGDNSFSLLTRSPARVIAVDLNPAQLACCLLRKAAYLQLEHAELLQLIGSQPCEDRGRLYQRCRGELDDEVRRFWDAQPELIAAGIGSAGKFERYFTLFRSRILPWVHSQRRVEALLAAKPLAQRREFHRSTWNTRRWRLLFKLFFSRRVMGRFGRDPAFFQYVTGSVSRRILDRSRHALSELDPADNPYLQWILTGRHLSALPHALRPEHFETIRQNISRIEFHLCSIEDYLAAHPQARLNRLNLSDIFEYMSEANYHGLLELLLRHAEHEARLVYWNMLVPRSRPRSMAAHLMELPEIAQRLFLRDKAFFYSRLVVEEVA